MSPHPGGAFYQALRLNILNFRRGLYRKSCRYVDRNYDLTRASLYGEPEMSIDYNKNQWRYSIDQTQQQGVLLKAWMGTLSWTPYLFLGVVIGGLNIRLIHNDKYNVFKKWRTVPDEEFSSD
jgi:hypothetical protein